MKTIPWYILVLVNMITAEESVSDTNSFFNHELMLKNNLVAISQMDSTIKMELKYATTDNFMNKNLYGSFNQCYLRKEAAEKLVAAQKYLTESHPEYHLLVYDALRPRRVQQQMWDMVKGTPQQQYVANPEHGSIHNYGAAVDLTIADKNGKPIDMGTPFDYFDVKAQPRYETFFIDSSKISGSDLTKRIKIKIRNDIRNSGLLTQNALENRLLLRDIMKKAGFIPLASEWWHFNAFSKNETRKRFTIVE